MYINIKVYLFMQNIFNFVLIKIRKQKIFFFSINNIFKVPDKITNNTT